MRKSVTGLLLVIEILLLFVFGNLSALFDSMEKREIQSHIAVAESVADLLLRSENPEGEFSADKGAFFSAVRRVKAIKREAVYDPASGSLQLVRPRADGSALLFVRHSRTPALQTLRRVSHLFTILIVLTALFLVITGFYLVYRFRTDRGEERRAAVDPMRDYLARLESSETSLRSTVQEQQLEVSSQQELNRSIIRHINAAILLVDGRGRVEVFNQRAEQLFERSAVSVLHHPLEQALAGRPGIVAFLGEAGNGEASRVVVSRERDFRVDVSPVGEEGRLVVVRDVTRERRRAEIRRRNASFAMLGEMAAFLTHEMRNSLGAVFGYTKTLKGDDEKVQRINKEITYLTGMLDNFLNFAKPLAPGERIPIDLTKILAAECADAGVELNLPEESVKVQGDPGLVRSLCSNLVRNAVEAGAKHMELRREGNEPLELRLRDDGRGIPADQRDKIWFPFFTTKEKGTGMGLALVRKVMSALDGDIRLDDSLEKGTEFRLTFFS